MGNWELLAVVLALQEWRHWLEGSEQPFVVWTDHKNLSYLQSTPARLAGLSSWIDSTSPLPTAPEPGILNQTPSHGNRPQRWPPRNQKTSCRPPAWWLLLRGRWRLLSVMPIILNPIQVPVLLTIYLWRLCDIPGASVGTLLEALLLPWFQPDPVLHPSTLLVAFPWHCSLRIHLLCLCP